MAMSRLRNCTTALPDWPGFSEFAWTCAPQPPWPTIFSNRSFSFISRVYSGSFGGRALMKPFGEDFENAVRMAVRPR